ncbi:MAG: hypothetical protein LBS92_01005 [Candidatus Methanoplasma sp.]|nr:hypothetical protein [Candidatus Methanoplasma sp.]
MGRRTALIEVSAGVAGPVSSAAAYWMFGLDIVATFAPLAAMAAVPAVVNGIISWRRSAA